MWWFLLSHFYWHLEIFHFKKLRVQVSLFLLNDSVHFSLLTWISSFFFFNFFLFEGLDIIALFHFRDPSKVNILVPGAGLGRLAWEIAMLGYACQGNEWSFFMLFSSNFVLNRYLIYFLLEIVTSQNQIALPIFEQFWIRRKVYSTWHRSYLH